MASLACFTANATTSATPLSRPLEASDRVSHLFDGPYGLMVEDPAECQLKKGGLEDVQVARANFVASTTTTASVDGYPTVRQLAQP